MQASSVKSAQSAGNTSQSDTGDLSSAFNSAVNKTTSNQSDSSRQGSDDNANSSATVSDQAANNYVDDSKYADQYGDWSKLTNDSSGSDDQSKTLGREYGAVQLLADNWQKWGLHDANINFNDPSTWSSLPPDAQKTLKVISRSPSMISALENTGAKDKKSNGIITLSQVKDFVKKSKSDLKTALSSLESYEKKNPNAGSMSLMLVRQAALVMANQTLIAGAGSQMQSGASDQRQDNLGLHQDNLSAVAADTGLGSALNQAANIMGQNAVFSGLDVAGNGPGGTGADGAAGRGNLEKWIKTDAPTSDASFLSYLSQNAIKQSLPTIDSKSIGSDVFENPKNYSGATKAAVLNQLETDESVMTQGKSQGLWSGKMAKSKGLDSNYSDELSDLQSKIRQLSADPDVQSFQKTAQTDGLQSIADSDPTLKSAITQYYNNTELTGSSLDSAINSQNSKGEGVSVGAGLQNFVSQATTVDGLLGKTGDNATNLTSILDKSGDADQIKQAYSTEILNGNSLTTALQSVSSESEIPEVLSNYKNDNAAFSSVLGSDYTQQYAGQIENNINTATQSAESDQEDLWGVLTTFCDSNGNISDSKIEAYVSNVQSQNPEAFNATTASNVVKEIKKALDLVRQGYKVKDSLKKIDDARATAASAGDNNPAASDTSSGSPNAPETPEASGNANAPETPDTSPDGANAPETAPNNAGAPVTPETTSGGASPTEGGGDSTGGDSSTPKSTLPSGSDLYSSGALHLTSAGMSAGALAASIVSVVAGSGGASAKASLSASAGQTAGTATEGAAKMMKKIMGDRASKATKDALKWVEFGGKELGAAAGIEAGVLSLISGVKDLKNGDKVDGGLTLTTGSLDTISGIAGGVDGAVSAADSAGLISGIAAGVAGTVAGIASGVAAGVGFIVGLVELIIQAEKKKKEQHNYFNQLSNLDDYGITGKSDTTKKADS